METLRTVYFTTSVIIPGYDGASTRATTASNPSPGVGSNCAHVKSIVLWGNRVIFDGHLYMPLESGLIRFWEF